MKNTVITKQLWTAGPEGREYKYTTIKVFCGSERWGVGINALLIERLHIHKSILTKSVLTAEQESVKDINLNISHAWGTPHKENKAAHPCISQGL